MKISIRIFALAAICALLSGCSTVQEPNLVPLPQKMTAGKGTFAVDNSVSISGNAEFAKEYLKGRLAQGASITLQQEGKRNIEISINPQSDIKSEGYRLSVLPDNITIEAADEGGAFYGVQTLLQLMPAQIYSEGGNLGKIKVPCVEIEDYPRFGYRGAGLDVSRTFFPLETIYDFIDWIAYHKINTFHWHITDDNGWRIEIKKYPLLTEKGAWRG
ncbi:MAG: family 20 glycosylhydrolase, partial [Bacteroidales bacterium]|nr:family 20 glycosylhydrolase [Bacteroidales bacterium]